MFQPLKNERFFERIAASIQREITAGDLRPGEKLPNESELAKQFNVGRSAVREALKVLELLGLLYVKRGRNGGTFVRPPDPDDSFATPIPISTDVTGRDQLMEARRLIEAKTAELAAIRGAQEDIVALGDELDRARRAAGVPARFIEADIGFHLRVAEAAKNEVFLAIISSLRTSLKKETNSVIRQDGAMQQIVDAHEAIYRRIKAREPEKAANEMLRHLQHVEAKIGPM